MTEAAGLRGLKNVDPGDEAAAAAEQTDERQQPRRSFDEQQEDSAMLVAAAAAADGVITRGDDGDGTETAAGESVDVVARRSQDADSAVRRTSAEGCPTVSRADDQCDRLDGVRPADDGVAAADSSRKAPSPSRGALVTSRGAEMTSRGVEKMAVDGRRDAVAAAGSDEDTER